MKCTYRMTVHGVCPENPEVQDEYEVIVESNGMILVEHLLKTIKDLTAEPTYQEQLTRRLLHRLSTATRVQSIGSHSGVWTECVMVPE